MVNYLLSFSLDYYLSHWIFSSMKDFVSQLLEVNKDVIQN